MKRSTLLALAALLAITAPAFGRPLESAAKRSLLASVNKADGFCVEQGVQYGGCTKCTECDLLTVLPDGKWKVDISVGNCFDGTDETLDWACCTSSYTNEGGNSDVNLGCDIAPDSCASSGAALQGSGATGLCSNSNKFSFIVPNIAKRISIQTADKGFRTTFAATNKFCAASPTTSCTGVSANEVKSSVCDEDLLLSRCPGYPSASTYINNLSGGAPTFQCANVESCNERQGAPALGDCFEWTCQSGQCVKVPKSQGSPCRKAMGPCDVEETCDGQSFTCPADAFVASTEVCRAAIDVCDAPETCTGSSAECPKDEVMPTTHVCRASNGACDVDETCTGHSTACPDDAFKSSSHECRGAAGVCDVAEMCTGSAPDCPADTFLGIETTCRAAAGLCDIAETCPGNSAVCPTDRKEPSGTVCRAVGLNSACDVAETCDGVDPKCPEDLIKPAGEVCRKSSDLCDVDDVCTGSSKYCGEKARKDHGYVYKAATVCYVCGLQQNGDKSVVVEGRPNKIGGGNTGQCDTVVNLHWPECMDDALTTSRKAANGKDITNLLTFKCAVGTNGVAWTNTLKTDVTNVAYSASAPYYLAGAAGYAAHMEYVRELGSLPAHVAVADTGRRRR